MKSVVVLAALILGIITISACRQEAETTALSPSLVDLDTINAPKFFFVEETFNFGSVSEGEQVSHTYSFKNVGKTDLIITSARGSCGCTVPEYPRQPIKPGEEGKIEVKFDSERQTGKQKKSVTIVANTYPSTVVLHLEGDVISPQPNN